MTLEVLPSSEGDEMLFGAVVVQPVAGSLQKFEKLEKRRRRIPHQKGKVSNQDRHGKAVA